MNPNDVIAVPLTDEERYVLRSGLAEWGGPARCTEELAVAMGFKSVEDLFNESERMGRLVEEGSPMSALDWARTLLATEIVFASDVVGALAATGCIRSASRIRTRSKSCAPFNARSHTRMWSE